MLNNIKITNMWTNKNICGARIYNLPDVTKIAVNSITRATKKYNQTKILDLKLLIENSTEYFFIDGQVGNYVNNGNSTYFENINSETTSKDNVITTNRYMMDEGSPICFTSIEKHMNM